MSEHVFDAFTRRAATAASRRGITRALAGFTFGGLWGSTLGIGGTEAGKKRKKKRKKKCKGSKKKCGKKCISKSDCCGGCPDGRVCEDGACACPSGQIDCQGTCISESECCTAADCDTGQICVQGQCVTGQGTCQAGEDVCIDITDECGGGDCYCWTSMSNETRCGFKVALTDPNTCTSDAECAALFPDFLGVFCIKDTGDNCVATGLCFAPCLS